MITPEKTIKQLQPKIKKSLYYTKPQDREELKQELHMKITEIIYQDVIAEPPGFWEFSKRFD